MESPLGRTTPELHGHNTLTPTSLSQLTLSQCNEQDYLSLIADNHQHRQIVKPTAQFAVTLLMGDKYPKHVECV
jgi:hypothetical protein